ncbi:hypothetical protein [Promicromonospora soli]|uniref:hypothetical protein n=1 Tax=Promicromonospora soli TaxID=2035533 RepID=UPI0016721DAB|nr:hypothetical protein [Promicromonospora soli]
MESTVAAVAVVLEGHVRRQVIVPLAVLVGVLAALVQALVVPPLHTGDETAHLDYAYQVWTGHLPVFEAGTVLTPDVGSVPPVQWVAQHPPLYYVLLAPVVGPMVDGGHLIGAVYAARLVNVLAVGLLVAVAAWATRRAFPGRSPLSGAVTGGIPPALVTALVVTATAWVARVGGSAYNDVLAALLTTWLFGLAASAIRSGLTWPRTVLLVVVSALCLGTRLHTMVMVGTMVGAVLIAALLPDRSAVAHPRRAARAWALALGVPLAVAAATGWFWLRNFRLTGSVTGGHPDWAADNLDRVARPVGEVVLDPAVWARLLAVFGHGPAPDAVVVLLLAVPALLAVIGTARAVIAAVRAVSGGAGPGIGPDTSRILIVAAGGLAVAATLAMQMMYTAGGGSPHPRYLLLVIAPLALVVARGLVELERFGPRALPWGIAAWCAVPLVDQALWIAVSAPRYAGTWPGAPLSVTGAWVAWGAACVCVAVAVTRLAAPRVVADPSASLAA